MDVEQRARELYAERIESRVNDIEAARIRQCDYYPDDRCAVEAIVAALTPPEGFVLVPTEPTSEMVKAALNAPFCGHPETGGQSLTDMWTAMLAARPEVKP